MMEEANVPVTLHVGTENGFRATDTWRKAPAFAEGKIESTEILLEPYSCTTLFMAAANYLTVMVLGGVFERHPRLRFGVIELGATWFGSLAEHLDVWAENVFRKRISTVLSMAPSAYMARNVRVTPFWFEHVDVYLDRHPDLQDSYCYSTDYPHSEGGRDTKARFFEKVKPFGEEAVRKFFVTNGEFLLPA
jgi:predicted TIM-barrel fold metal-dependent hydrolase